MPQAMVRLESTHRKAAFIQQVKMVVKKKLIQNRKSLTTSIPHSIEKQAILYSFLSLEPRMKFFIAICFAVAHP